MKKLVITIPTPPPSNPYRRAARRARATTFDHRTAPRGNKRSAANRAVRDGW